MLLVSFQFLLVGSSIEASAVVPLISFLLISTAMRRPSIALRHQQQLGRAERDEAEAELELEVLRHHAPQDPVAGLEPACLRTPAPAPGRAGHFSFWKSPPHARTLAHVAAVLPGGR